MFSGFSERVLQFWLIVKQLFQDNPKIRTLLNWSIRLLYELRLTNNYRTKQKDSHTYKLFLSLFSYKQIEINDSPLGLAV